MKILSYKETPNGTKILTVIGDARLDRLETEARAIEHVQTLPEFARHQDRIKESHALVKSLQSRRQKVADSAQYRDMLNKMASRKLELETLQAEYQAANPVYLTPANALLVDVATGDDIAISFKDNEYISLEVDDDGKGFSHSILTGEFMGKRYRKPGSIKWEMVEHPDEAPPTGTVFTAPTEAEYESADAERIAGLVADDREAEMANRIMMAESEFVRAHTLAEALSPDKAKEAKQDAKMALTEAKKAITARYKV